MFNNFNLSDDEILHVIDNYTNLIKSKCIVNDRLDEDLQQEIVIFIYKILSKNRKNKLFFKMFYEKFRRQNANRAENKKKTINYITNKRKSKKADDTYESLKKQHKKLNGKLLNYESFLKSLCIHIKKEVCVMIIDEFRSGSTLIRFDDRDIGTKENNKDIMDILIELIMKKISESS